MNEDELRAALRRGEGPGPDVDDTVATVRAAAVRRRVRVLSTASSVAVVAAIAVTVGVLAADRNDGSPDAGRPPTARSSIIASGSGSTAPVSPPSPTGGSSGLPLGGVECPSMFVVGSLPNADQSADLLPSTPSAITVCAYGSTRLGERARPTRLVLDRADATSLARSINAAPASRPRGICPLFRVANDHRLMFIAADGDRSSAAPVVTTLGNPTCSVSITNGSNTRYAWSPPDDLAQRLLTLHP